MLRAAVAKTRALAGAIARGAAESGRALGRGARLGGVSLGRAATRVRGSGYSVWTHAAAFAVVTGLVAAAFLGDSTGEPTPDRAALDALEASEASSMGQPAVSAAPDATVEFDGVDAPGFWVLDDPAVATVVVNKQRPLSPLRFSPAALVNLSPIPGGSSQQMTPEAAAALVELWRAAGDAGHSFSVATAYRSYGFQAGVYWAAVRESGTWWADRGIARPGYSEHQTGLAVDITLGGACHLQTCFGATPVAQWVAANGWRYGYIVRYGEGQRDWTGYRWEPWHLRYVGVELATAIHEAGYPTLEQYFGLGPAPSYG